MALDKRLKRGRETEKEKQKKSPFELRLIKFLNFFNRYFIIYFISCYFI